jgi:hypothetical protein
LENKVNASLEKAVALAEVPVTRLRRPSRKSSTLVTSQAELWPAHGDVVMHGAATINESELFEAAAVEPAAATAPAPVVMPEPALRPRSLSRRIVSPSITTRALAPAQPARSIARFLTVNGAVDGVRPDVHMRFDLPGRTLSNMLRLWRGTETSASNLPAYY